MKFILNNDILTIQEPENRNSGSIKYYLADVEKNSAWEGLFIEARLVPKEGSMCNSQGRGISVIDNKLYIDNSLSGYFAIGFVGFNLGYELTKDTHIIEGKKYYTKNEDTYTEVEHPVQTDIETYYEQVKTYQISTNLQSIWFDKGAGEIEVANDNVPSISEWEIYIAQIQEMIDSIGSETNYNNLQNKPQINNETLIGNKSLDDLGIQPKGNYALQNEIPTKTSDLNNDSGFIDKNVDDLTNYTKTSDLNIYATNQALNNEISARENADIGLQGQIDAITSSSDVVDIVGTYADLQNYDTTDLGNNDVIKVLQDSTHNDAMTYYRWLKTSSTWQYIGQEGPYYTKSETDLKLQNYEEISNKVTSISSSSTDTQYPSAKCVYDLVGNIESILETLDVGSGV